MQDWEELLRKRDKRVEQLMRDVNHLVSVCGVRTTTDIQRQVELIRQSAVFLSEAATEYGQAIESQLTPSLRTFVSEDSTILVKIWYKDAIISSVTQATRPDRDAVWGPPTTLKEEAS